MGWEIEKPGEGHCVIIDSLNPQVFVGGLPSKIDTTSEPGTTTVTHSEGTPYKKKDRNDTSSPVRT